MPDVVVPQRLAADVGSEDVDLPSRPHRVGDHVPGLVVDHLALRHAVVRLGLLVVLLLLELAHDALPELPAEREQRRVGRRLLPGERADLPPAPALDVGQRGTASSTGCRRACPCRASPCGLRRAGGSAQSSSVRYRQSTRRSVVAARAVPPARDMAELDGQIAGREIDDHVLPLRPACSAAACRRSRPAGRWAQAAPAPCGRSSGT